MNCHECHQRFDDAEERISISRSNGDTFWFHMSCFVFIAGDEYVRSSFRKGPNNAIDEYWAPGAAVVPAPSGWPNVIANRQDLQEYVTKFIPSCFSSQSFKGATISQLEGAIRSDLKTRIPMGIKVGVFIDQDFVSGGHRIAVTWTGTETHKVYATFPFFNNWIK